MSEKTRTFHVGFTYRGKSAPPVSGKPAWHGQYKFDDTETWWTVKNGSNLPIAYMSRVYAENAALYVATEIIADRRKPK